MTYVHTYDCLLCVSQEQGAWGNTASWNGHMDVLCGHLTQIPPQVAAISVPTFLFPINYDDAVVRNL